LKESFLMTKRTRSKYMPGLALLALMALLAAASGGCSAAANAVTQGCAGLDANASEAQATLSAWAKAVDSLNTAAASVEADWFQVCNDMNADLGLDTSKTTASDACKVLNTYIQQDLQSGNVTVSLSVLADCQADLSAQASCDATCNAQASCDVTANCTGGDIEVACNGVCHGQCDVTQPSFACTGTCKGECTASAAVTCTGECTGSCTDLTWKGTCDAGCTASFSGTCGGNCNGTCNGTTMNGACKGKCVGACDAQATGTCGATCAGMFSGGQCMGSCTGTCNVAAGAMCSGTCNGTCSYTPGTATCKGECHAMCDAAVSPPTCNGMVTCSTSGQCHANCQAQASANISCPPPQVTVQIIGDAALAATFQSHLVELGNAFALTSALAGPVGVVAGQSADTFTALGNVGLSGASCIGSELQVAATASAHVNVCVSAQLTVQGTAN
jgi:hypothetical protein